MPSPASAMTLTVLGAAAPFPKPDRPCSGYLLRTEDTAIWIDAGPGTFAELQRHLALGEIDAIWISHMHPDHWIDLLAAWNAYVNDDALPRPTVYGPAGWMGRFDAALGHKDAAADVFDVKEHSDRLMTMTGPINVQAISMHHSVPTFGLRAEIQGHVLAYSADTGPCQALVELAHDADLLVVEAGASKPTEFHITPEQAAETAFEAGAKRVVLTHVSPDVKAADALARFRAACPSAVDIATPGLMLAV